MNLLDTYQQRQEFVQEVIDRYLYLPPERAAAFRQEMTAIFTKYPLNKTVQNNVHIIHPNKQDYEKTKVNGSPRRSRIATERLRQLSVLRSALSTEEPENH